MNDALFALDQPLQHGAAALGLTLDETVRARIITYLQLLQKWNKVYNLTAIRAPEDMLRQHVLDALAVAHAFSGATRVLDVGAGGGIPGLILAILYPGTQFVQIDIVHKKTAFLNQARAELGLHNLRVETGRVEQLKAAPFDCITARAFADLRTLVQLAGALLAPGGRILAMKGRYPQDELDALPAGWCCVQSEAIQVPGLAAERHLLTLVPQPSAAASSD